MPPTLLLADDSVTIQRVIELTFADEDVRVVAVSDGDQAISALDRTPPDIVLADVGMPGRNGYEVARYIKDTPRLAHIPVLLLTGAFEPVDEARAAEVGCDGVLAKPFEPQLVISRVKELLARSKQVPALDRSALSPGAAGSPEPAPPWTAIFDEPIAAQQSTNPPPAQMDNYFDRLDAAFTRLSSTSATDPPTPDAVRTVADEIDWFANAPPVNPAPPPISDRWAAPSPESSFADLPLHGSSPSAPAAFGSEMPTFPASSPASAPPAPPPPTLPPLADAFAALLAAEQSAPASFSAAASGPAGSTRSAPALSEEAIEEVTRRVLDRLSDRVVRETVAEIVSAVAERLVREEIERIKRTIE